MSNDAISPGEATDHDDTGTGEPTNGDRAGWDDQVVVRLLTRARLRSYLAASSGDLTAALRLYEWNAHASAAVMATSGMVEVVVRNALDEQLTAWAAARHHASWLDAAPLDTRGAADVTKARDRATNRGRTTEVHGKVVAELSFGFWRYAVAQRYHAALWVPALQRAFPYGPSDLRERRRRVERRLTDFLLVRNRSAHHEPIHRRDLLADLKAVVELVGWIHPDAGRWVATTSFLPEVVAARAALP